MCVCMCEKGVGMRDREQAVNALTLIAEFQIPICVFYICVRDRERKRNCVRVKIQCHAESAGIKFE